jgi:hypothetical protein
MKTLYDALENQYEVSGAVACDNKITHSRTLNKKDMVTHDIIAIKLKWIDVNAKPIGAETIKFCDDRIAAKDAVKFPVTINQTFLDAKPEIVKQLKLQLQEKIAELEDETAQLDEYLGEATEKPEEKNEEPIVQTKIVPKKVKKDFDM